MEEKESRGGGGGGSPTLPLVSPTLLTRVKGTNSIS